MIVKKLNESWKEISIIITWTLSVTGSFLIPLPSWSNSSQTSTYYISFMVFISAVISGFLVLYTLKNHKIKFWFKLSITLFFLLFISTITYFRTMELKTLPYYDDLVIIGSDLLSNNPIEKARKLDGIEPNEVLSIVHGKSEMVWTQESIDKNRLILTSLIFLVYILTSTFIIAFSNLILLFKKNNENS